MSEANIKKILEDLKKAYREYDISYFLSRQRRGRDLFVVRGFNSSGDIHDWSVDAVRPLLFEILRFLKKNVGVLGNIRLLFVRDNQFMLHSPDIGNGNVFRKMKDIFYLDCYGFDEYQYYIGECSNINDVVDYLVTTDVWF